MLAAAGKHDRDTALAATARVHDLVLVTRNVKHMIGRDVRVLDPFVNTPMIKRV
jgi:predicted nucleic acid-binding protein